MDVTDDDSVQQAVNAIVERERRIDVVVSNAGIAIAGPLELTSIEEAKRQLDANFFGAFRVCRAVLPIMRRQGHGYIINIGSIGGHLLLDLGESSEWIQLAHEQPRSRDVALS
jgi:NAD(P)-dependent dehydrogenase (short-subunit alcohol dehydrogenase family)